MNIKDIAKAAGVSTATVSRVLNDSGYVKDETRRRILAVIDTADYIPNEVARSLSTKQSPNIGVIIPDIGNAFFAEVIRGISSHAASLGYNVMLFDTCESLEKEHQFLENAKRQWFSGILITPVSEEDPVTRNYLLNLERQGVPVVLIDRDANGIQMDGVFADNTGAAYEGMSRLVEAGHKKIGIITGLMTSKPGRERLLGALTAIADHGLPVLDQYIFYGNFMIEKAYEGAGYLCKQEDPPTAVFTANNMTTLGVLKYFTEKNITIGKDMAILGFDQIETLKIINYPLSTIERDASGQGREAFELLLRKLKREEIPAGERRKCVPHQVVLRGSEKLL